METQKNSSTREQWLEKPSKPFLEVTYTTPTKDKNSLYLPFQQKEEIWRDRIWNLHSSRGYALVVKDVTKHCTFKPNTCIDEVGLIGFQKVTWPSRAQRNMANYSLFTGTGGHLNFQVPEKIPFMTAPCTGEIINYPDIFQRAIEEGWFTRLQARSFGKTFMTGAAGWEIFNKMIIQQYGK